MTKDEALRLGLEALKRFEGEYAWTSACYEAVAAIEAALEAKDEPLTENGMYRLGYHNGYGFGEAYGKANAPQRTWVEVEHVRFDGNKLIAKLKEKNT
jgi:hypothetical protein